MKKLSFVKALKKAGRYVSATALLLAVTCGNLLAYSSNISIYYVGVKDGCYKFHVTVHNGGQYVASGDVYGTIHGTRCAPGSNWLIKDNEQFVDDQQNGVFFSTLTSPENYESYKSQRDSMLAANGN